MRAKINSPSPRSATYKRARPKTKFYQCDPHRARPFEIAGAIWSEKERLSGFTVPDSMVGFGVKPIVDT